MKPSEVDRETKLSRRRFFTSAGAFMTGAVATAAGFTMLPKKAAARKEDAAWPYPYVKLDPEVVREKAYVGYYANS